MPSYWTDADRAKYARAVYKATAQVNRLEDGALRDVQAMLNVLRRETIDRLAWAQIRAEQGYSTYDVARLGTLQHEIDSMFFDLRGQIPMVARDSAERLATAVAGGVDAPIEAVMGTGMLGDLPTFTLARSIAAASALVQANLITGASRDAIRAISNEIALGATGLKSPIEVMEAVGRNLVDPSIFTSLWARAETIVRTEMGRVRSVASQARQDEASHVVPELKKQWQWSGVSRITHAAAHGQIRDVHQDYSVGGEYLSYPRDPKGSAENTINCGCSSLPYIDGLSEKLPEFTAENTRYQSMALGRGEWT